MQEYSELYSISKKEVAPVLYAYTSWVIKEALKRDIATLYFLARDGYVLREIAQRICNEQKINMECRYLYCSRMALRKPTYHFIGEEAYRLIFMDGCHVSIRSFFDKVGLPEKMFSTVMAEAGIQNDIDIDAELNSQEILDYKKLLVKSSSFVKCIVDKSKQAYELIEKYFRQENIFEQETLAIVDSGWAGSMQRSLRQLLQSMGWEKNIVGFYFGMFSAPKLEDGEYCCFYFDEKSNTKNKILFSNSVFECFLSAPHGMTIGYIENIENGSIEPVFRDCIGDRQRIMIQEQINGILAGIEIAIQQRHRGSLLECQKILRRLMGRPNPLEAETYGRFYFCDNVTEAYHFALASPEQLYLLKYQLVSYRLKNKLTHGEKNQSVLFWDYGVVAFEPDPLKRVWYWLNIYIWKKMSFFKNMLLCRSGINT